MRPETPPAPPRPAATSGVLRHQASWGAAAKPPASMASGPATPAARPCHPPRAHAMRRTPCEEAGDAGEAPAEPAAQTRLRGRTRRGESTALHLDMPQRSSCVAYDAELASLGLASLFAQSEPPTMEVLSSYRYLAQT